LIINGLLGKFYELNGQDEQAIEQLRRTLEMDLNFGRTHLSLAELYEGKGMFEEAADEYGKTLVLMGGNPPEVMPVAPDFKSVDRKVVRFRVRPSVPIISMTYKHLLLKPESRRPASA
jgi:tetratricopeptide (TPR) repeat protein